MNEENVKKEYEEPTVQKVEFDFNEVITASNCENCFDYENLNPVLENHFN